jgi:hypothetical protein
MNAHQKCFELLKWLKQQHSLLAYLTDHDKETETDCRICKFIADAEREN